MVIIAFSEKTSKLLPRFFCRKFKHTAPIIPIGANLMILYQFTTPRNITMIYINKKSINRLRQHGWKFIYVNKKPAHNFTKQIMYKYDNQKTITKCGHIRAFSCVNLSKQAINLHAPWIQTPDELYKYLNQ